MDRLRFALTWLSLGLSVCLLVPSTAWGQDADDFTIVVLPDTQNYSKSYPDIFNKQTEWISANAAANKQNIKLVIGVGDIVDTGTDETQWGNAERAIRTLEDNGVPYALAIGNHDYTYQKLPPTDRNATNFNEHFGPWRYAGTGYYGASNYPAGSNENFYVRFTWGTKKYLILVLEFVPRSGAIAWAKGVLNNNLDREVIVVTHSYLFWDGTTVDECDTQDMPF